MNLPSNFTNSNSWREALNERESISAEPAVYALLLSQEFGRLVGSSNILYIGHTGQFGGSSQSCRLRIYNYPNGRHALEICRRTTQLIDSGVDVTLQWVYLPSKTEAIALEADLLKQYLLAHGELPPFNSRV